jgi:hypothetical protein
MPARVEVDEIMLMSLTRDQLNDSYYLHVLQVGAALRKQYAVDDCLNARFADLLKELDEPEGRAPNACETSRP